VDFDAHHFQYCFTNIFLLRNFLAKTEYSKIAGGIKKMSHFLRH
jgi:hypothetical protein